MPPDEEVEQTKEDYSEWSKGAIWADPGIHIAVVTAANDVVTALRALSAKIKDGLHATAGQSGEDQMHMFDHHIHKEKELTSIRIELFHLLTAISSEGLINRFCYFELPNEVSETLEKLQPTEKLLVAATFLGQSNIKSSHVYGSLKYLVGWRNLYAHGHNPGRSARSLHKNHAVFPDPEEISTLEDELSSLRKAAGCYRNVTAWLKETGTSMMTKISSFDNEAARIIEMIEGFSVTRKWLSPDSRGVRFQFFELHVDLEKLSRLGN
ncbi:hypothetical protein H7849_19245 [Alloacidobacterium dinghuense]|uniref:Uncharacterized protein n=1 Tax=Alloacidobacterium dinghuense TaxID=2763107 RepID=A0A7G8BF90_9BACT|nr:hypothetical protein [Alloacidobacterium dinghuense]QNI31210.1 hypothetical protein H7849_19245 [Alloacidobacterium dinghuense]